MRSCRLLGTEPAIPVDASQWPDIYPLVSEAEAARQSDASPSYQGCKVGTPFWHAEATRSVRGNFLVYVRLYGPRRAERG